MPYPDRAIAFTHEYDGQPPRGAGLRPGPLYGAARSREPLKSKTRSQKLF
jgi:hypothetical protein